MLSTILFLFQAVADRTPHMSTTPTPYEPTGYWSIEGVLFIAVAVIGVPFALGWFYVRDRKTKTGSINNG